MADKDAPETALVLVIFVSAPEASIFLTLGTLEDNIEILFSINHRTTLLTHPSLSALSDSM